MATHIKQLINKFLENKAEEFNTQNTINKIIEKCFDSKICKEIKLKQLTKDKVVLGSNSSGLAYTINLNKQKLLKEIKKDFPKITKIQIEHN